MFNLLSLVVSRSTLSRCSFSAYKGVSISVERGGRGYHRIDSSPIYLVFQPSMGLPTSLLGFSLLLTCFAEHPSITAPFLITAARGRRGWGAATCDRTCAQASGSPAGASTQQVSLSEQDAAQDVADRPDGGCSLRGMLKRQRA
jgi:hypothetical protein